METKNEQNCNGVFPILEGPLPWSESTIKRNHIEIEGKEVKVYHTKYLYAGIVVRQKPIEAYWNGNEVIITMIDGAILKYSGFGYWDRSFVNGRLTICKNKLLVFSTSGDCIPIYTEDEITRAFWTISSRRHIIQIQFKSSRHRDFKCPDIYESCWSSKEYAEELNELLGDLIEPSKDNKGNEPVGERYDITFFRKFPR